MKIGVDVAAVTQTKQTRQVTSHIDPEVQPVAQPLRRVALNLQDKVEEKIQELLDCEIIEEVNGPTPWVNTVVIVPKPNGEVRLCIDMRYANKAIIRGRHPIPTVDELLKKMAPRSSASWISNGATTSLNSPQNRVPSQHL